MAKKRPSAIELARAGSSEVERMGGRPAATPSPEEPATGRSAPTVEVVPSSRTPEPSRVEGPDLTIVSSTPDPTVEGEQEQGLTKEQDAVKNPPELVTEGDQKSEVQENALKETSAEAESDTEVLYHLPIDAIRIGGINTRVIDEEDPAFRQLVESIEKDGQLEPVLVGREGDSYRLIAGERRVRALRAAGLSTVLARVTTAPPSDWPGLMMIENLMRKDLTVWEEAAGYKALLSMGLTQEEAGRRIHKNYAFCRDGIDFIVAPGANGFGLLQGSIDHPESQVFWFDFREPVELTM